MNAPFRHVAHRRPIETSGDMIARVLARFAKTQEQIANDARLFRMRAKRETRAFIRDIRDEGDLLNRLHVHWLENVSEPPANIDQAISRLEHHLRVAKSHTGTHYANGNHFMSIKSRLFLARYVRRFGLPS